MSRPVRVLLVLLVLVLVVAGAVVVAELVLRQEVEERVQAEVEQVLADATDDGEGFARVDTEVDGYALLALATERLERVSVRAEDGVVRGVPLRTLEVDADGLATDGSTAESLDVRVVADAVGAVATLVDPAVAETARAVADDRLELTFPVELPLLSEPLEIQVQVQVSTTGEGGVVAEPVSVSAAGLDLDVSDVEQLPRGEVGPDDLPAGLRVTEVLVEGGDEPVVRATGVCDGGCSLTLAD